MTLDELLKSKPNYDQMTYEDKLEWFEIMAEQQLDEERGK